jgi:predicted Zn-dependent protease
VVASLAALAAAQQESLSNIIGQLRVIRGDFPSHPVMVELQYRGSTINTAYADSDGKFGFSNLVGGEYHVIINDPTFDPVDERFMISPNTSGAVIATIMLRLRAALSPQDPAGTQASGTNPSMVDWREFNKHFPKKAIKEYDQGVKADAQGEREQAVAHYQKAIKLAPDYYPAHNNLGSDYLSKADIAGARKEFETVVQLNQSDAAGYFNLTNLCLVTGDLKNAQQYLDEGLHRQPDSALGEFLLGSLNLKMSKYLEAESALQQAIKLSPDMAQAHLQLVNLFLQLGKLGDAEQQLQAFVAKFPNNPFTPKAKELLRKLAAQNGATTVR